MSQQNIADADPFVRELVGSRKFDLFELFPDGYVLWRGTVQGLKKARVELQELATRTKHEVHLMYTPNNEVIAKRNAH